MSGLYHIVAGASIPVEFERPILVDWLDKDKVLELTVEIDADGEPILRFEKAWEVKL